MGLPLKKHTGETTRDWLASTTAFFVSEAQKGSKTAMSDLVLRINQRLSNFCLYLTGNQTLAQDLSQEIYVKLLENINTLPNPNFVVPWVYRIARNHYIDYLRSANHKRVVYMETLPESPHSAHQDTIDMELPETLQNLEPDDRFLLLIVYVEGCSYKEAAEILGVTEHTVRSRLYRLKKKFPKPKSTQAK